LWQRWNWRALLPLKQREREGEKQGLLTRDEGKRGTLGRRRIAAGEEIAGEEVWIAREMESSWEQRGMEASGSGASWGPFFLKTRYGRTGQSTVPVRCTPDSAQ
jgi:hypothetical protein